MWQWAGSWCGEVLGLLELEECDRFVETKLCRYIWKTVNNQPSCLESAGRESSGGPQHPDRESSSCHWQEEAFTGLWCTAPRQKSNPRKTWSMQMFAQIIENDIEYLHLLCTHHELFCNSELDWIFSPTCYSLHEFGFLAALGSGLVCDHLELVFNTNDLIYMDIGSN